MGGGHGKLVPACFRKPEVQDHDNLHLENRSAGAEHAALQQAGNTPTDADAADADVPLNDCVHQLYKPAEGSPSVDIVFFHGLQLGGYENAWRSTWVNSDKVFWPQAWLAEDFPTARILSVSYDSCANRRFGATGNMDMQDIGNYLVQQLVCANKVRLGEGNRPVVLVGHSLGGIVLKQLFVEAATQGAHNTQQSAKCREFEGNLAGAFFYATPHGGAGLAGLAEATFTVFGGASPVLQYLKVLSKAAAHLNLDFANRIRDRQGLDLVAVYETQPLKGGVTVVEAAAAMQGMNRAVAALKNHSNICKPQTQQDMCYRVLVDYISDSVRVPQLPVTGFGLEERVDEALKLPSQGIVIWGAGGMGKTTFAKALFNARLKQCVGSKDVFVELPYSPDAPDVPSGKFYQFAVDMGIPVGTTSQQALMARLHKGRIVILLDNVMNSQQLQLLLPKGSSLAPDTYIILTTRNKQLVRCMQQTVPNAEDYPMLGLSRATAKQLLRSITQQPDAFYDKVKSEEQVILDVCDGMPLALELVGAALQKQPPATWQAAAEQLQSRCGGLGLEGDQFSDVDLRVEGLVSWSLSGLKEQPQKMFYDVAVVLAGELESIVVTLWLARCFDCERTIRGWLDTLKQRCLVSRRPDGRLQVHDVLIMTARGTSSGTDANYTRLWDMSLLKGPGASQKLQHVQLLRAEGEPLPANMLPKLRSLHAALDVSISDVGDSVGNPLPSLKWLRSQRPSMSIVEQLTQLVVLEMPEHSELAALPDAFSQLQHLHYLDISWCTSLTNIDQVQGLTALRCLYASRCSSLVSLPDLGALQALQQLHLSGCSELSQIPGLSQLTALMHLDCSNCKDLLNLDGLGKLARLTMLLLSNCAELEDWPTFDGLAALQHMDFSGCGFCACPALELPVGLTTLKLGNDQESLSPGSLLDSIVWDIPTTWSRLASLQILDLRGCEVRDISPLFGLVQLRELDCVGCCVQLPSCSPFPSVWPELRVLKLHGLATPVDAGSGWRFLPFPHGSDTSVGSSDGSNDSNEPAANYELFVQPALPEWLCGLQHVTSLRLVEFKLPTALGQLAALQQLELVGMCLEELPDSTTQLSGLRVLRIVSGGGLRKLPDEIGNLSFLEHLDCFKCLWLTGLPSTIGQLHKLQTLSFACCHCLTMSEDLRQLSSLSILDLREVSQVQENFIPTHLVEVEEGLWEQGVRFGTAQTCRMCASVIEDQAVAPEGAWVQRWIIEHCPAGVVSIQGVLNNGGLLMRLGASHMPGQYVVSPPKVKDVQTDFVSAPTAKGFTSVHGRCDSCVNAFMGCGDATHGSEFVFECPAGHRVVGYKGVAEVYVGRVKFLTKQI